MKMFDNGAPSHAIVQNIISMQKMIQDFKEKLQKSEGIDNTSLTNAQRRAANAEQKIFVNHIYSIANSMKTFYDGLDV